MTATEITFRNSQRPTGIEEFEKIYMETFLKPLIEAIIKAFENKP
jgi:hypothetical protein